MDFVSPEHLFEELPLTKEEASILDAGRGHHFYP